MDIKQRIEKFNTENKPFYIVDHESERYSLCLPLSFLKDEYKGFGQKAFNSYALQVGDPIKVGRLYTHGNGYEWRRVFKKAFENEVQSKWITFDCEAGGFFCYSSDFDAIEKYGNRFRKICMNEKEFTELVCKALSSVEEITPLISELAVWGKQQGMKSNIDKDDITFYLNGEIVAIVNESGEMGYPPLDDRFDFLGEISRIKDRLRKEAVNQGMKMNM